MMDSSHSKSFKDVVITRVGSRKRDSLSRPLNKDRPLYRSRKEREDFKITSGGKADKSNWFRKSGERR